MKLTQKEFSIPSLGDPRCTSPYREATFHQFHFFSDTQKVRYLVELLYDSDYTNPLTLEVAGPREYLFFKPEETTAAIVTCGGLSPGINNVVRSTTIELLQNYKVKKVFGIQHGYNGFTQDVPYQPRELTIKDVEGIHLQGGSILGSSRGLVDIRVIVDRLKELEVNMLFCVGGDGTQRGALEITEELAQQNLPISVVGIPKTIDNDVPFAWQSFGFSTAVEKACGIIESAKLEAESFLHTVSIVKLMGRDAGFISLFATLASQDVDFTLIPEVPFSLAGEGGLLDAVEKKISEKGSVVIVVSEGVGSHQQDIGVHLSESIKEFLRARGVLATVKYFDPGYSIRAVPANTGDAFLCDQLSRAAVHAAMAGKTGLIIGHWYNNLVHIPLSLVCSQQKRVDPNGKTWQHLLSVTQQGQYLKG